MSRNRTRSSSPSRGLSLLQRIDGELRAPPKGPRAGERQIFAGVRFFCFPGGHDRKAVSELREVIQVGTVHHLGSGLTTLAGGRQKHGNRVQGRYHHRIPS
jgi:hypothetical protein